MDDNRPVSAAMLVRRDMQNAAGNNKPIVDCSLCGNKGLRRKCAQCIYRAPGITDPKRVNNYRPMYIRSEWQ